jgi:FKBP-type peptidyl-prolyl cis-trans isomerase
MMLFARIMALFCAVFFLCFSHPASAQTKQQVKPKTTVQKKKTPVRKKSAQKKQPPFIVTPYGLKIALFTHHSGKKPYLGDVIRIHLVIKTQNDSVLSSTYYHNEPAEFPMTNLKFKGDPMEGYTYLSEGDSALFIVNADSFLQGHYPHGLQKGSSLKFYVKMLRVMDKQAQEQERIRIASELDAAQKEQLRKDTVAIVQYLRDHHIPAKRTGSGLYYIIDKEGTGPNAIAGSYIDAHYKEMLLDGTAVDSSYARPSPFVFTMNAHQVIPGWDEGIALLNKGARARLFIPSYLGYGKESTSKVPPNSPLIFEVRIEDIRH